MMKSVSVLLLSWTLSLPVTADSYRMDDEWVAHRARLMDIQSDLSALAKQAGDAARRQPVSRLKFDFTRLKTDIDLMQRSIQDYLGTRVRGPRYLEPIAEQ